MRLPGYDYAAQGVYFVTICTAGRGCWLGQADHDSILLSAVGTQVERSWQALPEHFHDLDLDAFVVMPNHLHGLVILHGDRPPAFGEDRLTEAFGRPRAGSLSTVIRSFKSAASRAAHALLPPGETLWQRGFHEHIVRDDDELGRIRYYSAANPCRWAVDRENPGR
ncbi:MAG: transposase [Armatimonadetes bacterium]|nr:transposase [Armatimonadota bacterium]